MGPLLLFVLLASAVGRPLLPANNAPYKQAPLCEITASPVAGNHIGIFPSDPLARAGQSFMLSGTTLTLAADPSLCLGVGADAEPGAGTPSIDLLPCNASTPAQQFVFNATTQQLVNIGSNQCVDWDNGDNRADLYGCNDPVSPNQQWMLNASTGVISSVSSPTLCLSACVGVEPGMLGAVTGYQTRGPAQFDIFVKPNATLRVTFVTPSVVRIWLAPMGTFTDPAAGEIAINTDFPPPLVVLKNTASAILLATSNLLLTVAKVPALVMKLQRVDTGAVLWQEAVPLQWNTTTTWQSLVDISANDQYYGCGMQNGYFSHRGRQVLIQEGGGWADGGRANPAPYYMTTRGVGVLRNTYAPGQYSFVSPATLAHDEFRFDAFYFLGPSLKDILGQYTLVAGRPFMPPIWGLHLGDSDCYNNPAKNRTTIDALVVAQGYRENDMPGGWLLPNDGYGCGYTSRAELVNLSTSLGADGFAMGLWTSTGLANASWEIGVAGSRAIKTDVGWVGAGYKFGLDAVKLAASLIEGYSTNRRYTWTVCGWALTHTYAVMWNGDNSGSYEYIRFQIPTVLGSSLSAQAHTSGDVDGIFGGYPDTYVRDLQWKCFLTVAMTMSGWATYDKQPWRYGEPYTTYSRTYLKLKVRLTPFQYTLSRIANQTGVPPSRPLVLEYPDDPVTWGNATQYQFLSGEAFLVAPVYTNTTMRDGIYLPAAEWVDYWTGVRYVGPRTVDAYAAPLNVLPVFVKAGSIIPMWPEMNYWNEKPHDPITLDVYLGSQPTALFSNFTLYEDDGLTQSYAGGAFAAQLLTLAQPSDEDVLITVGASVGSYAGKPAARGYMLTVHQTSVPVAAFFDATPLPLFPSVSALNAAPQGFCPVTLSVGVVTTYIKIASQPLSSIFSVSLQGST